ncbi:uncharacterized protein FOMMEDRAFT_23682 [Fomitiporia mediterranea MF3/22]|uniref:uncharacterized protein n=1 Tax=Fomitiporia mediterranea (strain MF3/22) TaxID=694068 RepID=UPI0004408550|nr:uncharacterized protein FOMMEDRAFT_23682 [Fomitiporia mediterranea MF3/22]EJC98436.1 hypothetical protein FOMMEDRAFT_23682 [Fomitiporia mediterranea MF3/22]
MAYLARRPDTHLIRVLMLPSTVAVTLHSCFGYVWVGRGRNVYNWGEALVGLMVLGKALDYALVPNGHYKVGEKRPGDVQTPAISKKDYDPKDPTRRISNGYIPPTRGRNRPLSSILPLWLQDGLELVCAARGVGWDWGKGVYIPKEERPLSRGPFLLTTLSSFLYSFLALDLLESLIKLVPGVGLPTGGSIFLDHLPPLERYGLSTAIHFGSGFALLAGFQMVYDLCTLIGVGVLCHDPTSWPPIMDRPWSSDSLHSFWAKRWHQLLRQTFLTFGGRPVHFLLGDGTLGKIGMVLGTFAASGVYHELSSTAMGRGMDGRVVLFFVLQGVLVILERVWRVGTGRRVGGWFGRVWVYFVIGVLGQPLVDAWHKKGLAGGMIIPPIISPTRRVFFPLVSRYTGLDLEVYPL